MPRYSLAPLRPDYLAAVSVAHFVSGALTLFQGAGSVKIEDLEKISGSQS